MRCHKTYVQHQFNVNVINVLLTNELNELYQRLICVSLVSSQGFTSIWLSKAGTSIDDPVTPDGGSHTGL